MNAHPVQITIEEILTRAVDPCERKHGGNPQSAAAHVQVLHTKDETYRRIMEVLDVQGPSTSKEIASTLNKPLHTLSGRFSEMKKLDWIRETPERRDGAAVLTPVKPIDDFDLIRCPKCGEEIVYANRVFCYVCEDPPDMCGDCLDAHVKTHSEVELDAALMGV